MNMSSSEDIFRLRPHSYKGLLDLSTDFKISVNGQSVDVCKTERTAFASYECNGAHQVTVTLKVEPDPSSVRVLPIRHADNWRIEGNEVQMEASGADYYVVEVRGLPELFIYANQPAPNLPDTPNVTVFSAGKVHELGEVQLEDNQTLWIEGGAVLRGNIRATRARGVRIGGYGVLDGSYWKERGTRRRSIVLDNCENCRIEGIIMIHPTTWMLTIGACHKTVVQGIKQVGECRSSDGIDVVGSTDTRVRVCCLRNADDNIAVKALDLDASADPSQQEGSSPYQSFAQDVKELRVESCVFWNDHGGSATEIGYETRCDRITDIVFRDIDVLAVHNSGSVFGIHSGDRALIENVLWENIRVEHHYDKLIDIRLLRSRWNRDPHPGQIRSIRLRNIDIRQNEFNEGYTINLIGGYDAGHTVEGVVIENFVVNGERLDSLMPLQIFERHASGITLSNPLKQ